MSRKSRLIIGDWEDFFNLEDGSQPVLEVLRTCWETCTAEGCRLRIEIRTQPDGVSTWRWLRDRAEIVCTKAPVKPGDDSGNEPGGGSGSGSGSGSVHRARPRSRPWSFHSANNKRKAPLLFNSTESAPSSLILPVSNALAASACPSRDCNAVG